MNFVYGAALTLGAFLFQVAVQADFWGPLVDKYGIPSAALALSLAFIWNRQKKADSERNGLIQQNNILTEQLIKAVKEGSRCKFEK